MKSNPCRLMKINVISQKNFCFCQGYFCGWSNERLSTISPLISTQLSKTNSAMGMLQDWITYLLQRMGFTVWISFVIYCWVWCRHISSHNELVETSSIPFFLVKKVQTSIKSLPWDGHSPPSVKIIQSLLISPHLIITSAP